MLIGLGGGAASSMAQGASAADLDFASVQRDNAEMERRCQEVIDRCWALGDDNPIRSIHDVGAGGCPTRCPSSSTTASAAAHFELREVPNDEPGMSPLEIWCNEAQERYVLGDRRRSDLRALRGALRARALPVRGASARPRRSSVLTRRRPRTSATRRSTCRSTCCSASRRACTRDVKSRPLPHAALDAGRRRARGTLLARVLRIPTVADKTFLITIGDRTVRG